MTRRPDRKPVEGWWILPLTLAGGIAWGLIIWGMA